MLHTLLSWSDGSWLPWIYIVLGTHFTNVSVSLYLHRSLAHGGLTLHPVVTVPMRIWIWLNTSMDTQEWVAVHRKHHVYTDKKGDPHSPKVQGIWAIALFGWWQYNRATQDPELIVKYGKGCPQDWLERKILKPAAWGVPIFLATFNVLLFGKGLGLAFTAIQLLWMPLCGDIINGIGHYWGYRNTDTRDWSRNIIPWAVMIAGEELHNNHHADPRSPRFRIRWFELDVGWIYIRALSLLGLAQLKRTD